MTSEESDENSATKHDDKKDLSSLITLSPAEPESNSEAEAASETQPDASTEPVEFESLDKLSQNFQPDPAPFETGEDAASGLDMSLVDTPAPQETAAETATELESLAPQTQTPMDSIKSFSEALANTPAQVGASFPFTLKIEGKLTPEEVEKLFTVLTRENMGFREVDLEPQIAEGRLLIPRISEYAGVVLIQALRGISAKIQFGPSDEVFSTPETRDDFVSFSTDIPQTPLTFNDDLPVSNSENLPQFQQIRVLDTVITSGLLTTKSVEATHSEEYTLLLEALVRELKFKARRRGANGILSLQITLTPLTLPTDYRVTVSGSAVIGQTEPVS